MKQFKKLAMLIAGLWCCMAVNAQYLVDGICYNFYYTGEAVVESGSYTGKVEIPESVTYNGKTYSVTSIGGDAFRDCTGLASITIPNSVTRIESEAFFGCTGLTSITIPNSVTIIESEAFFGCTGLASITIPNSVTSIGNYAFYGCTGLASITIPNSVTSIGNYAFYGCN